MANVIVNSPVVGPKDKDCDDNLEMEGSEKDCCEKSYTVVIHFH